MALAFTSSLARTGAAAGAASLVLLVGPRTCVASGPLVDFQVARAAGAADCPDAAALAASVSRIVGRTVVAEHPSPDDLRVEVSFVHGDGHYVATVRAGGERTIDHVGADCAPLAEAVAAALAMKIDDGDEEPAATAMAEPAPAPAATPALAIIAPEAMAAPSYRWYGWQILTGDLVSLGLTVGTVALGRGRTWGTNADLAVAATAFGLDGPLTHAFHHRWVAAGVSLGLRLVIPTLGGLLGWALSPSCSPPPSLPEGLSSSAAIPGVSFCDHHQEIDTGLIAGLAVAVAIDASTLAWDRPKATPRDTGLQVTPLVSFVPLADGQAQGLIGIQGSM